MNTRRYIPIIQKPYCCAMACLSMILYRRTMKLYDQEELAVYFGVHVTESTQGAFSQSMQLLTSRNHDEGVKTIELAQLVERFFGSEGLNLICSTTKASDITNLEAWIQEHIEADDDIWCEYVSGDLLGSELYLHDGLIESYDRTTREITMINPEGEKRNRFQLSIEELADRISGRYSRETGFLVIRKI